MPAEKRVSAAAAFWRDDESPEIALQQAEAAATLARRLKFRQKSIFALPLERRARHLAQLGDVSDTIATRALIAYHFADQRPLMGAFLDALGISHDNGLIKEESLQPPAGERIAAVIAGLKTAFDPEDVDLYLRTLVAIDGETWAGIEGVLN